MRTFELTARLIVLRLVRASPYRPRHRTAASAGLIHDRIRSRDQAVQKHLARTGASIHGSRCMLRMASALGTPAGQASCAVCGATNILGGDTGV
jgi:hypothetical protein